MSKLPWAERVNMLSINPDAATRDDVASMAAELKEYWMKELDEEIQAELMSALQARHDRVMAEVRANAKGTPYQSNIQYYAGKIDFARHLITVADGYSHA